MANAITKRCRTKVIIYIQFRYLKQKGMVNNKEKKQTTEDKQRYSLIKLKEHAVQANNHHLR